MSATRVSGSGRFHIRWIRNPTRTGLVAGLQIRHGLGPHGRSTRSSRPPGLRCESRSLVRYRAAAARPRRRMPACVRTLGRSPRFRCSPRRARLPRLDPDEVQTPGTPERSLAVARSCAAPRSGEHPRVVLSCKGGGGYVSPMRRVPKAVPWVNFSAESGASLG